MKAVSDGGVRAPLYWFHDHGYFEEFLGHKKDLWFHPTGLALHDKVIWSKTAENLGLLHSISIPDIDQAKLRVSKFSRSALRNSITVIPSLKLIASSLYSIQSQ